MSADATVLNLKRLARLMPARPHDSHKGMFGTVAVIGGQRGMVGAPLMAARAALKLGAGCVHVGLLADDAPSVDLLQPELMLHRAAELLRPNPDGTPNHSTKPTNWQVAGYLPQAGEEANVRSVFNPDVLAIGCGMGTDLPAHKLLHDAMRCEAALLLDADALNILAMRPDLRALLAARKAATVLTPHPGEAARLLDCKTSDIQGHRQAAAAELRLRFHSSVVLKGTDSVCATRDGKLFINPTGNPGMSAAGMGDVLTGMIAALLAQGLSADDALCLAVYLHGTAGDELAKQQATLGMTATEVTEWARWLLNRLSTH